MDHSHDDHRTPHLLAGRYELQGLCGKGGMGAVYRAVDTQLQRTVAVKCVQGNSYQGDAESILREAKILASFSHENVVQVYDVVRHEDGIWLISEFLDGSSLDRVSLPIGIVPALAILEQLYGALAALHERHIYHRDLKPGNIFLTRAGIAKLIDFGVAFDPRESTGHTLAGTLQYCDPRILAGEMPQSSSDLYSSAIVLLELLSGEKVWPELAPLPIYRLVTKSMETRIGELTQRMFPPLASIIHRCTSAVHSKKIPDVAMVDSKSIYQDLAALRQSMGLEAPQIILSRALKSGDFSDQPYRMLLETFAENQSESRTASARERSAWISYSNPGGHSRRRFGMPRWLSTRGATIGIRVATTAIVLGVISGIWITRASLEDGESGMSGSVPKPAAVRQSEKDAIASFPPQEPPQQQPSPKILQQKDSHRIDTSRPANPQANTTKAELTSEEPANTPTSVPVTIIADAWADVFVDGKSLGRIPRAKPFMMAPGIHTIRLSSPLIEKKEETVTIPPVENYRLTFKTEKRVKRHDF